VTGAFGLWLLPVAFVLALLAFTLAVIFR